MLTQALFPYINQAIGLDLSENMVAEYTNWARAHGHPEKMRAYRLDLLDPPAQSEMEVELAGFDVVLVCMALHHVTDAGRLLARLRECLRPGGVCVVVDGVPSPMQSAGEDADTADLRAVLGAEQLGVLDTINKHGFTEGEMWALYEGAGLGTNFEYEIIERPLRFTMFGHSFGRIGFIARGEK
jgi:SAM-dependent methyltransferase